MGVPKDVCVCFFFLVFFFWFIILLWMHLINVLGRVVGILFPHTVLFNLCDVFKNWVISCSALNCQCDGRHLYEQDALCQFWTFDPNVLCLHANSGPDLRPAAQGSSSNHWRLTGPRRWRACSGSCCPHPCSGWTSRTATSQGKFWLMLCHVPLC